MKGVVVVAGGGVGRTGWRRAGRKEAWKSTLIAVAVAAGALDDSGTETRVVGVDVVAGRVWG